MKLFDVGPKPVRDLFGVKDIMGGVVELEDGGYAAGLEVGSLNWSLMTPEEQEVVEAGLYRLAASIRFPVQVIVQRRLLDLSKTIESIRERASLLGERSRAYALYMAQALQGVMSARDVWVVRRFVIVRFDAPKGMDREAALAELGRRLGVVAQALSRSVGVEVKPLSTYAYLDLIHAMLEKDRALSDTAEHAESEGYLAPVVGGDVTLPEDME